MAEEDSAKKVKKSKINIFDRGISKEIDEDVVDEIDERIKRRIESRKGKRGNAYMGLIFMGTVGWSFVFPFVLSIALGVFLDNKFTNTRFWTLHFIFIGLFLGITNVAFWIKKETRIMRRKNIKTGDNKVGEE